MSKPIDEEEIIVGSIASLRAGIMAIVFAVLGGTGLTVATVWLLVQGGPNVGEHLSLLENYFPGYSVSWSGAIIGGLWAAGVGGLLGWLTAWIYNWVAGHRISRSH